MKDCKGLNTDGWEGVGFQGHWPGVVFTEILGFVAGIYRYIHEFKNLQAFGISTHRNAFL